MYLQLINISCPGSLKKFWKTNEKIKKDALRGLGVKDDDKTGCYLNFTYLKIIIQTSPFEHYTETTLSQLKM